MKASFLTLGCKVNDVESSSLAKGLETLGYEITKSKSEIADFYILNTCAVTKEAERKSRQAVARILKRSPSARIVVCGCASEKDPDAFLGKENVVCVVGARKKAQILELAKTQFETPYFEKGGDKIGSGNKDLYDELPTPKRLKTRNFIKVQDGCDRFCSYCIIPYLRGRSRSRSFSSTVKEIMEADGYETVLTGIDVSSYRDGEKDFADLLLAVKDSPARIRLGSLEEELITEKFLSAAKEVKNFAPQFHLCLQSGSNAVLRAMNRRYTREEYLKKCQMIYEAFPNATITTDIIVGFPTEGEEEFSDTLRMVEEAGFLQIHCFPYSPREGTNAWKKYPQISGEVKKDRLNRLMEAGKRQREKVLLGCVGKTFTFLPETFDGNFTDGYSETYIKLYVEGKTEKKPIKVVAKFLFKDGMKAEILSEK